MCPATPLPLLRFTSHSASRHDCADINPNKASPTLPPAELEPGHIGRHLRRPATVEKPR